MKQQYLLFLAMGILVVYSLTFPQKELNQNPSSNDTIKVATENDKQITPSKVDEIKSQLVQTESYESTRLELISKFFIQDEDQNLIFSAIAFFSRRIDFRMSPLQI
jgi:hypothetical protein